VGANFVKIAAGSAHCLALKSDGSILGWGHDEFGQATPPAGNDYIAVAAGAYHSLALKSNGSIVAWGANGHGQAISPEGNDFISIAAGKSHNLALKFVCRSNLLGDNNNDCKVDMQDLAAIAANWLIDCYIDPSNSACIPK
jgi:alpha-tubulin suppressor-like RCC1 family protein